MYGSQSSLNWARLNRDPAMSSLGQLDSSQSHVLLKGPLQVDDDTEISKVTWRDCLLSPPTSFDFLLGLSISTPYLILHKQYPTKSI